MKFRISVDTEKEIDFKDMENSFFLIGLLNEFMNSFQAAGDSFFEEVTWKQCFAIICVGLFDEPPTLRELSEVVGSSHQNVKQLLLKLEKAGFVQFISDEKDRRKQRILLTEKTREFNEKNDAGSAAYMGQLFESIDPKDLEVTVKTMMQLDEKLKVMRRSL